ncbi:hypothetical protein [Stenomitos frigidus]|uniref:Uncharacterized protein n=1 Tax=Stenomitos frigidus ULC18 TaxID=2107698 RepID=A0A2T1DYG3_9CYAN|nr:hypothetical protein [Stenomitos frigidus]PSB25499.1 hypothetical protein C7B82_23015 [Stenomitos frigidus ULC18]
MTQRRSRRPSDADTDPNQEYSASTAQREMTKTLRARVSREDTEVRMASQSRSAHPSLTSLIERDAPLQAHSMLVLMYGPFQAEMIPEEGQGVASWLKECVRKHGIPSLLRFDYRRRAQVFRRDQFQPWLEPLLTQIPG